MKIKKRKKVVKKEIEILPVEEKILPVEENSNTGQEIKISSFDGDFGRQDINLLRDKVNEIINYINNQ